MGSEYLWLLKTDDNGTKLWDRIFGGFVSSSGDGAWSVDETRDGGYIVTGYTKSFGVIAKDLWLVKTDSKGIKQWDRTFGGSKDDVGMSVVQTRDGGYAVTGRTASYGAGKDDIWLMKTDSAGREQWNRTFGGPGDDAGCSYWRQRMDTSSQVGLSLKAPGREPFCLRQILEVRSCGRKFTTKTALPSQYYRPKMVNSFWQATLNQRTQAEMPGWQVLTPRAIRNGACP